MSEQVAFKEKVGEYYYKDSNGKWVQCDEGIINDLYNIWVMALNTKERYYDDDKFLVFDYKKVRVLKVYYPKGHPYWQRNKYKIELPNGEKVDCWKFSKFRGANGEEYEILITKEGVFVQYFKCSSGMGKNPYGDKHLLVKSSKYDHIEYIGKELRISKSLAKDIKINKLAD